MERWEQEAHLAQASNSPPAAARERWRRRRRGRNRCRTRGGPAAAAVTDGEDARVGLGGFST